VGIEVFITLNTYESLPETGESCQLYTYLHVREDILSLYGFADPEEKNLFLKLISLNGIGPRNAQSMLSGIKADEFRRCILSGDIKSLTNRFSTGWSHGPAGGRSPCRIGNPGIPEDRCSESRRTVCPGES
jgi:Holliday junction resolvasome RuvABC DNA-binding subunit